MLSDQYELAVLRALRDPQLGGWATSVAIADEVDLPPWTVRSALKQLVRRRLVERGAGLHLWGTYSITDRGLQELAAAQQMRIVT